jgi:hypothetical protein
MTDEVSLIKQWLCTRRAFRADIAFGNVSSD